MARFANTRSEPRREPRNDLIATVEQVLETLKRQKPDIHARHMARIRQLYTARDGELAEKMIAALGAILEQGERELREPALTPEGKPVRPRVSASAMLRASRELREWIEVRQRAWREALEAFSVEIGLHERVLRDLDGADDAELPEDDDLDTSRSPGPERAPTAGRADPASVIRKPATDQALRSTPSMP
jgi:hypothetical protein